MLVGEHPTESPRLGESLNAEGSLEMARQFPDLSRFFFPKQRLALFFGEHALTFDSVQYVSGRAAYQSLGYPPTVQLLHVDRVGFDPALLESVLHDQHCTYVEDRVAMLDYRPATDRIEGVQLAGGKTIASTYVFDATNLARFVARHIGVGYHLLGEARRVVFAHYSGDPAVQTATPPWMQSTSLLRLNAQQDPVEGLAWLIPLGGYVSAGVSVAAGESTPAALVLDWVGQAFARRGLDARRAFPTRGTPVDVPYDHYTHDRCYGSNWLLTGPSCCQFWFPSAAGVATGLVAARLAPDVLRAPNRTPAVYQAYIDAVAASHSGLEWLVRDDAAAVTLEDLQQRPEATIDGNIQRLADYAGLEGAPPELAFGDALLRMFQADRHLANPLRIDTAPLRSQATRLFAKSDRPDPWMDAPLSIPVLTRPEKLDGPPAILDLVDILSGRSSVDGSAELLTQDAIVRIDQFHLEGVAQWNAWVASLRNSPRVAALQLVPSSLATTTADGAEWTLTAQWQGSIGGAPSVSLPLTMTFVMDDRRVSAIHTERADYTFVAGDSILPAVAFASLLGQLTAGTQAVAVGSA